MSPALFWFFSLMMIAFAILVVVKRNPVASALSLVVSFIGLAALFVSLDAYFIGTIQILVYAGAVMVLFLFIIMLLDLKAEEKRVVTAAPLIGGIVVGFTFLTLLIRVLAGNANGKLPMPALPGPVDDVKRVGELLFSQYNLPLQIIGTLLLVATVGVVVLSKRELK